MGVILDDEGTFGAHTKCVMEKAEKSTAALGKLIPNIGGPTRTKTRKILLNGVANSVILYEAPVRYKSCEVVKHSKYPEKVPVKDHLRLSHCIYSGTLGYSLGPPPHRPSGTGKGTPIRMKRSQPS